MKIKKKKKGVGCLFAPAPVAFRRSGRRSGRRMAGTRRPRARWLQATFRQSCRHARRGCPYPRPGLAAALSGANGWYLYLLAGDRPGSPDKLTWWAPITRRWRYRRYRTAVRGVSVQGLTPCYYFTPLRIQKPTPLMVGRGLFGWFRRRLIFLFAGLASVLLAWRQITARAKVIKCERGRNNRLPLKFAAGLLA